MSRSRRLFSGAALLAGLLAGAGTACADEFRLVPSISAKEEYNSNLFFSSGRRIDSFVTTATPGVEVLSRTERTNAGASAYLPVTRYSDGGDLDAVDQLYRGDLAHRFSTEWKVSAGAGYRNQSRPDRFIEEAGLAAANRSRRYSGGAAAECVFDEVTSGNLSYTYEKIDFRNSAQTDSESHGVNAVGVRDLGKRFPGTKARGLLGATWNRFDTGKVDNYNAAVGIERAVHELWSVTADVGVRYTRSELDALELVPPLFTLVTTRRTEGDFGWTANVSGIYKGEKTGGSLTLYHDVAAAPGRGGAAQRSAAVLDLRARATYELTALLSAGYYRNRSSAGEFSSQAIDDRTVRLRPGLRYDATKNISAEAAWQFTRVFNGTAGATATQNVAYLMATLRYPLYE